MKRILFIIGNGLSIDLRDYTFPRLEKWDTSRPLQWDLYTPDNLTVPWLQSLPKFNEIIPLLRKVEPDITDFEIFKKSIQFAKDNAWSCSDISFLKAEMQHFLAIAYSYFQSEVDKRDLSSWYWLKWLKTYGDYIQGVVSFNYDLLIETALKHSGLYIRRFGVVTEKQGIPILKPHGSIDFDLSERAIKLTKGYPMKAALSRNDGTGCLKSLDKSELTNPRAEADIVLPLEYPTLWELSWVSDGYDYFKENASSYSHCIIFGL